MDADFNRTYDDPQSQMFSQNANFQPDSTPFDKRVSPYQVLLAYIYFYLTENGMHDAANMLLSETKHNNSFFSSIKNDFDFSHSLNGASDAFLLEWWDMLWSTHCSINPNLNLAPNNTPMGPPSQRVQDLRRKVPQGPPQGSPGMKTQVHQSPVSLPSQGNMQMQNLMQFQSTQGFQAPQLINQNINMPNSTPLPHASPPVQSMQHPTMTTPMMGSAVPPTQYRRMSMQSSKAPRIQNKVQTMPNTPMSQPASAPTPASAPVDFMNMGNPGTQTGSNTEMDPMFIDASWFTS